MNSLKIIGHRGARGLAPENTTASLRKAIEHGVDLVEFDVRVTADAQAILHHDPKLTDQAGNHIAIAQHSFKELQVHQPELATLQDAAQAVDHQVPMLIEIKPGVVLAPIIKALRTLLKQGWKPAELILESRDYGSLKALHRALPELPLAVIDRWSGVRGSWRAQRLGTRWLVMNQRWLWSGFIRGMDRRGWQLYAYTINDPSKAHRWSRQGLAGIITDYPDRFQS
jgi:glycerophosphoryl diester phosphodiesterase